MQMYKDMVLKLQYHKEQIIKEFLKKGIYPSNSLVSQELSNIDYRLALFKSYKNMPGEKLNVKELNKDLEMIYKDLEVLYKVLEELYTTECNKLLDYIESHIDELDSTVDKYVKRAEEETNSTTLGNTLYFESNSFNMSYDDNKLLIDLGTVSLYKGSKIACFANVNNLEDPDIKFEFNNVDVEYDFKCLSYNQDSNAAVVPGNMDLEIHDISMSEDFQVNGDIKIPLENLEPKNTYDIMGGKGLILVKSLVTGKEFLANFPTEHSPIKVAEPSHISFYITDGDKFEYNFNMKPNNTNFTMLDSEVTIDSDVKKVFISAQTDFTFYFTLNKGNVFAFKEKGLIKDDALFYYGVQANTDMQIREYKRINPLNYNATVTIQSDQIADASIDCIYIKEL